MSKAHYIKMTLQDTIIICLNSPKNMVLSQFFNLVCHKPYIEQGNAERNCTITKMKTTLAGIADNSTLKLPVMLNLLITMT